MGNFASKSEEKRVTSQKQAIGTNPMPVQVTREVRAPGIYIEQLMEDSARIEIDHGFDSESFGETIALIHSELSEALEEARAGHSPEEIYYRQGDRKPEGIAVELADAIIRIAAWTKRHGVPLDRALKEKQAFNEGRPFKHGKRF